MEYVLWCHGHRHCERMLTLGRDGCVNEQPLTVAEIHVQELHGENAPEHHDQ